MRASWQSKYQVSLLKKVKCSKDNGSSSASKDPLDVVQGCDDCCLLCMFGVERKVVDDVCVFSTERRMVEDRRRTLGGRRKDESNDVIFVTDSIFVSQVLSAMQCFGTTIFSTFIHLWHIDWDNLFLSLESCSQPAKRQEPIFLTKIGLGPYHSTFPTKKSFRTASAA